MANEHQSEPLIALPPGERNAVFRAIDANLNRWGEALRVVEDVLRFGFADRFLVAGCKSVRHALGDLRRDITQHGMVTAARDSMHDPGRNQDHASEYRRRDLEALLSANLSRAQQAARSLEEFLKVVDAPLAMRCEQLRYRCYDLEKAISVLVDRPHRLTDVRLCVLVPGFDSPADFERVVNELIEGGVDMIQLRDKQLDDRILLARAERLATLTRPANVLAIVNDRCDIALASGADGVHLGQEDLPIAAARRACGANLVIGVSCHALSEAQAAAMEGADYIGVGPCFPSTTKSFAEFPGLQLARDVAAGLTLPAFAIGGIKGDNIRQIHATGLNRIAVSGGVLDSDRGVAEATRRLKRRLEEWGTERESSEGVQHAGD